VSDQLEVLRTDGDSAKPPILFLHGAWLGAWCWQAWMDFFNARGHTVIAPSYRAHGGSSGRERLRLTRLSEYVEDATSVLRSLEVPPIVIAHSMGGAVAQRLLETQAARGVVLVASVPSAGALGATLRLARHHPLVFLKVNLLLSLYPAVSTSALVREMFYNPSTPEAIVQDAFNRVQDESYTAFLGMLAFRSKQLPVSLPKLVIGGDRDGLFTPAEIRATAQFHNAALKLYSDSGHNLMLEENNLSVAQDIAAWLEEHGL
jgi:pimeloyl-ACP methyl ester carboxylesterase